MEFAQLCIAFSFALGAALTAAARLAERFA
jgi:hypothetical protein